jgi:hypothetical protein
MAYSGINLSQPRMDLTDLMKNKPKTENNRKNSLLAK